MWSILKLARPGSIFPGILLLAIFIPKHAHAADWTTWETVRPDTKAADAKFSPDGTLRILFTEESSASTSAPLKLKLAKFNKGRFTFSDLAQLGPTGAEGLNQDVRLIGDHRTMWAVWRRTPTTGDAVLHAAKIYPTPTSLNIETIQSGATTRFFDAAMGSDGQPRVAFINPDARSVTVTRRTPAGTWQKKPSLQVTPGVEMVYPDLALATRTDQLALVVTTVETGPPEQSPRYRSRILAYSATETATWSNLTFGEPGILGSRSSSSDLPYPTEPEAHWAEDGLLHVGFVTFFQSIGQVATYPFGDGIARSDGFFSREFGNFTSPGLGVSSRTGTHLAAAEPTAGGQVTYVLREDRSTRIYDLIPGLTANSLDLELDSDGNPWLITRHPNENLLQITALTDVTDEDNDGVPFLIEHALRMNPEESDADRLPGLSLATIDGQRYPTLAFLGQGGGTGNNPYLSADYSYRIEISDNLEEWSSASSDIILTDRYSITGRGTVSIYRSTTPFAHGEFLRLVIRRR
ncbi:hypothetical protein V2O64_15270 [Verrucomicrobiaceae bacterium 227]